MEARKQYYWRTEERRLKWFGQIERRNNTEDDTGEDSGGQEKKRKVESKLVDGIRSSMIRKDLKEGDAEYRNLWRNKIYLGGG